MSHVWGSMAPGAISGRMAPGELSLHAAICMVFIDISQFDDALLFTKVFNKFNDS